MHPASERFASTCTRLLLPAFTTILLVAGFTSPAHAQCTSEETQELTDREAKGLENLGYSVALSDDLLIAGAPGTDLRRGAVHAWERTDAGWIELDKLIASDGQESDRFGTALAVEGRIAMVGAVGHVDDDGEASGATYVFGFNGTRWVELQKIFANDARNNASFGSAVAIDAHRAVIGAAVDRSDGLFRGAAYVYRSDGFRWVEVQKLVPRDGNSLEFYGRAVSISGDFVAVGSPYHRAVSERTVHSAGGPRFGKVYLYRFDGSRYVLEQQLTTPDTSFGFSVSLSGDALLVGAIGASDQGRDSGAAYVYRYDGELWQPEARLTASDGGTYDRFGFSVALDDDTAVIGCVNDDDDEGHVASGSAYVFAFDGKTWHEDHRLVPSDPATSDQLGYSVDVQDHVAVAGAWYDDTAGEDSGAALVFSLTNCIDACFAGTVDRGRSAQAADVLLVNGRFGSPRRRVRLPIGEPLEISMAAPPAGPESAPFALYAWLGEPDATTISPQPLGLGTTCLPTFLAGGMRVPTRVWNNAGREPNLGTPDFPSSPAPSVPLSRSTGLARNVVFTLQGLIADDGSAAERRASVTNAAVIETFP